MSISNKLVKLFVVSGIKVIAKTDPFHSFHGPFAGKDISPEIMKKILEFRDQTYTNLCPYLSSETQKIIDENLALDKRSTHFYAMNRKNEIVGCLRLTPGPFEISGLTSELGSVAQNYSEYLEISRYIAARNAPLVAERLLFFSGTWIWTRTKYRGMIAFCREKLKEHYRRYGITDSEIVGPFYVPWRQPLPYYIVTADFEKIGGHIKKTFITDLFKWHRLKRLLLPA